MTDRILYHRGYKYKKNGVYRTVIAYVGDMDHRVKFQDHIDGFKHDPFTSSLPVVEFMEWTVGAAFLGGRGLDDAEN